MHPAVPSLSLAPRSSRVSHARANVRPLVFLAEDDMELRRMLCESLRDAGYDVLSASTGHEMLKLLTAASRAEVAAPDVIVMDVRMPRCGGLDVLAALRLADWQQPVIMITGFGDPSLHERATSYGASVSLDKPVDTDDLVDIIDLLLINRGEGRATAWLEPKDADDAEPQTAKCPTLEARIVLDAD